MKAPAHFWDLRSAALPFIKDYKSDLIKHDRRAIRRDPTTPFLHVTRDFGSYITMLHPPSKYPEKAKEIPYLFGTATREHILREIGGFMNYCKNTHPDAMVHHFDGKNLHRITYDQGFDILARYTIHIQATWSRESRKLQAVA